MKHTPFPWVRKGCLIVHEDKNGKDHIVCDLTPAGDRELYKEDAETIINAISHIAETDDDMTEEKACNLIADAMVSGMTQEELEDTVYEHLLTWLSSIDEEEKFNLWEDFYGTEPNPFTDADADERSVW